MRVAVCFSGQLRGDYKDNIAKMKSVLPKADYFFTTWDDQPNEDFIQRRYTAPDKRMDYPQERAYRKQTRGLEIIRESGFDPKIIPKSLSKFTKKQIEQRYDEMLSTYEAKALNNFQHVAHALTVKDFVDQDKYDIIIRCRYDIVIYSELKVHIKNFCEQVYDNGTPYGFCCFNDDKIVDTFINPEKVIRQNVSRDCNDFMIIHKSSMFSPDLVLYLFEQKALRNAEGGWYQTLCEPYGLFSTTVLGFVRMQKQHDDQNNFFESYKENPYGIYRHIFPETMGTTCDDVERLAD